jgi:hypothetical protein
MAAYVDKSTLKKFFKAVNPFAVKPAPPNPSDEPDAPGHKHSFSCPCNVCDAETARLTLARLKSQSA